MKRMARTQDELLVRARAQDGPVVRTHHLVVVDAVPEGPVRHLEVDVVSGLEVVDVAERVEERRSMSGDADHPSHAGQTGVLARDRVVVAGPLLEVAGR